MTEVAQPKLFTRLEPERRNLHPDYINDVLFSPSMDEPKRMYDQVNALGGRRGGGLRRSPDVVDRPEEVENIWEEEEEEEHVDGSDGNPDAEEPGLYEVPEPGPDLDRFVEDEFQFLDSDDDDEGEGRRRLVTEGPLLGTMTDQQTEMTLDPSPPSPQPLLTNLSGPGSSESAEELVSSDLEEPVVSSRPVLSQESVDVDEVSELDLQSPPIPPPPPPPPLPPAGVLFAINPISATEQFDDEPKIMHQPETTNAPETTHGAGNVPLNSRPKERPKNEPESSQNVIFLELQGILNRRLRKIDEDIEKNRETESSIPAAAAVPIGHTQESLNHEMPSDWRPPEQKVIDADHHLNTSFLTQVPTEESDVTNNIYSVIPDDFVAPHVKDSPVLTFEGSKTSHLRDSVSTKPPEIESFAGVLSDVSDSGAAEVREEFSSRSNELSPALLVPGQVEELEYRGEAEVYTNHTEVKERLAIPAADETVLTSIPDVNPVHEQLLHLDTEAIALTQVSSPASVPDVITSAKPQPASVPISDHIISSPVLSETSNPVVKRTEQVTRPRPSSHTAVQFWEKPSANEWTPEMDLLDDDFDEGVTRRRPRSGTAAVHFSETPSGDEWTPQMDLLDDEFDEEDDDFPREITSRRHQQKRQTENAKHQRQQQKNKRAPSKLYQKKQLGGPQRPVPNPGAFSLARINRAVKRVFGSISAKTSKQRAPISNSVFLQEDGWEIYPARPYDESNPEEAIKVVDVEKRPAYAYNAFTRELVILPDHDRILVTADGRRIRDQEQSSKNGRTMRPTSPTRNTSVSNAGNREKPLFASKSKASNPPRPPNLNTKTVKSIHMHGRPESFVEDGQTVADDAFGRRNSNPNFAGPVAASVSSANLSKRKTSTLSKILSFRKSSGNSTANAPPPA